MKMPGLTEKIRLFLKKPQNTVEIIVDFLCLAASYVLLFLLPQKVNILFWAVFALAAFLFCIGFFRMGLLHDSIKSKKSKVVSGLHRGQTAHPHLGRQERHQALCNRNLCRQLRTPGLKACRGWRTRAATRRAQTLIGQPLPSSNRDISTHQASLLATSKQPLNYALNH